MTNMDRKFLVISKGVFHPSLIAKRNLKKLLKSLDTFSFVFKNRLEDLEITKKDDSFTGLIFFFHEKKLSDDLWQIIDSYCEDKRAILLIHGAMASFKSHKAYQELAGGSFKGHKKPGPIEIKSDNVSFYLTDELYTHNMLEGNHIWLKGKLDNLEEPILWTRTYKKAKVGYFSLGHFAKTFKNENVKNILKNTLEYLSGSKEEIL